MPDFKWPEINDYWRIGNEITRLDGPVKSSGAAVDVIPLVASGRPQRANAMKKRVTSQAWHE